MLSPPGYEQLEKTSPPSPICAPAVSTSLRSRRLAQRSSPPPSPGCAPELDVRLTEAEPRQARQLLAGGKVDLAVTFDYDNLPGSEPAPSSHLFDDQMLLVLPPEHPLATRSGVDLVNAADQRWIAGCPRRRAHLVTAAAAHGFVPDIWHSSDDYVVTQTLVATGLGVALLPTLALAAARDPRVTTAPLEQHPPRRINLQSPSEVLLSPATRTLAEELLTVAKDPDDQTWRVS